MLTILLLVLCTGAAAAETPAQIAAASQVLWLQPEGVVWSAGEAGPVRGDLDPQPRKFFSPIAGLRRVVAIAINHDASDSAAAIDADGYLWLWGELGMLACRQDCDKDKHIPQRYAPAGRVQAVALGAGHLLALGRDGRVRSAGDNALGQLGSGPLQPQGRDDPSPRLVEGLRDVVAVAAQNDTSLLLRTDGTLWGMGSARFGLLGRQGRWKPLDFEDPPQPLPVRIHGLPPIQAIALGRFHALALDRSGQVWGWGSNESAQLESPAVALYPQLPHALPGLDNAIAIAAGDDYSLVLKRDGSVWARGGNVYGTLGDGGDELEGDLRRVEALDGKSVVALFAGDYNAFARLASGGMLGWGGNSASAGGFDAASSARTLLPAPLERARRAPPPSAAVRAGAAAFEIAAELADDQAEEKSELWIGGKRMAGFALHRSGPRSHRDQQTLELAGGMHRYEIRGVATGKDGVQRRLAGSGALIVTLGGAEAAFAAAVARHGLLDAYRQSLQAAREAGLMPGPEAELRSDAAPAAAALDALEHSQGWKLPLAYRAALQDLGPFVLGDVRQRYPPVALYAPAQWQRVDDWVRAGLAWSGSQDVLPGVAGRDADMLFGFKVYAAPLQQARSSLAGPWHAEFIAAQLPDGLYMLAPEHAADCADSRAGQRLVDFFATQRDEASGEERQFAWAGSADCELDLRAALHAAVYGHYTAVLRSAGAVFLRAGQEQGESPQVLIEHSGGGAEGPLQLRLSGGETVPEY